MVGVFHVPCFEIFEFLKTVSLLLQMLELHKLLKNWKLPVGAPIDRVVCIPYDRPPMNHHLVLSKVLFFVLRRETWWLCNLHSLSLRAYLDTVTFTSLWETWFRSWSWPCDETIPLLGTVSQIKSFGLACEPGFHCVEGLHFSSVLKIKMKK